MESLLKYNLGGDPVQNLRSILRGQVIPNAVMTSTAMSSNQDNMSWMSPEGLQTTSSGKTNFYAEDIDDDLARASASQLHFLLRQQDEYIEQLELENKTVKNELKSIQVTARQITEENQRILHNWKTDIFRHLLPKKEEKGMSDEEKVFYERRSNEQKKEGGIDQESKIKQLENELSQIRKSLETTDTSDQLKITAPKKEWNDLLEINAQLRETVTELRSREDEAQAQIKKGIQLVEEAHLEKTEAMTEREQLKSDLMQQKNRTEDLRTEYEERIQAEQSRMSSVQQRRIEEAENEVSAISQTLDRTKVNLERAVRDKRELEMRFEQAEVQREAVNEDLRKAIAALRADETRLRIEHTGARREVAVVRDAWERSKQEHVQEVVLLKSDLSEAMARLKRMERDYVQAKGEVAGMAEKVLHLETERKLSAQLHQQRPRDVERYVLSKDDGELSRRHDGLERVIEQQMHLVSGFRSECKRLAEQLDRVTEESKRSDSFLRSENTSLSQRLVATSNKCKRLEAMYEESEKKRRELSSNLQLMKTETAKLGQQVIDLLQRQTQLLKDRQFLRDEMHFLHDKLNA